MLIKHHFWPINHGENRHFLLMAGQIFLTILVYSCLRSAKDSLVVVDLGAEAISFIDLYIVLPASFAFVLLYSKLVHYFNYVQLYRLFALAFMTGYALFAFILLPNPDIFLPSKQAIDELVTSSYIVAGLEVRLAHFKWFLLIYSKWTYAFFYLCVDLWNSIMNAVLFWQLANQLTKTSQARRFYPMYGFFASLASLVAGTLTSYIATTASQLNSTAMMQQLVSAVVLFIVALIVNIEVINRSLLKGVSSIKTNGLQPLPKKASLSDSMRVILASKYLWCILMLLISYNMTTNLMEGIWKSQVRLLYTNTSQYLEFMGHTVQWVGAISMLFMLFGAVVMQRVSWLVAASITPIVYAITGVVFFGVIKYGEQSSLLGGALAAANALTIAVAVGAVHQVLSKSTKFALFDATKEMAYIPLDPELKTKGKAATDSLGGRIAKSSAALVVSTVFIIFPSASYSSISWILMLLYLMMTVLWLWDVRVLAKLYSQKVSNHDSK